VHTLRAGEARRGPVLCYMSYGGCRSKFDVRAYIARHVGAAAGS
jgi:hypothetical protein